MTISYRTSLANARLQAVADDIDGASNPGYLEICSASYAAVLATFTLARPCGTVAPSPGRVLGFDMPRTDSSADTSGTAAVARIKDGAGNVIVSGLTVGATSGFDIVLSSTTITAGAPISLNSGTITHPS